MEDKMSDDLYWNLADFSACGLATLLAFGRLETTADSLPAFAGWGSCKSCGCQGYIQGGVGYQNCKACGHHFSQHK